MKIVAVVGVLCALALASQRVAVSPATAPSGISAAQRAATFRWDATVDPASRSLIEASITSARPEAQRLIAAVDGLVTLGVGDPAAALGVTAPQADGTYVVTLDLSRVQRVHGVRGVHRLVLHELGHVVDFALVPDALKTTLDARIPAGLPCAPGTPTGACAPREERFAETFAKWAMFDDIGADLYIGYAVPPTDFSGWAQPLVALEHP